ncbi:LOW QUALITY PROTEIN: hypothetical protein T265_15208, partial [Opisthorchis viverrini]
SLDGKISFNGPCNKHEVSNPICSHHYYPHRQHDIGRVSQHYNKTSPQFDAIGVSNWQTRTVTLLECKLRTKGLDDFGQFMQEDLRLLFLFKDEDDIVRIFHSDKAIWTPGFRLPFSDSLIISSITKLNRKEESGTLTDTALCTLLESSPYTLTRSEVRKYRKLIMFTKFKDITWWASVARGTDRSTESSASWKSRNTRILDEERVTAAAAILFTLSASFCLPKTISVDRPFLYSSYFDEEGVTAAAATVFIVDSCLPMHKTISVDHPFFFALVRDSTMPVFVGHVVAPNSD